MRRSRTTHLSLGLLAVLVNVALVAGVVHFLGGGSGPTPSPTSGLSADATAPAGKSAPADVAGLVPAEQPVVIGVLGDGTGDESGEWVTELGELLGTTRKVTLHNLDLSDPTRYAAKLTYGSTGPATTIWNGSRRGATADYAANRLGFLVPEEPDVIFLNFGRDDTAEGIGPMLDTTLKAIKGKWPNVPVLAILQAQDRDDAIGPVREATASWAKARGVGTVDVAGAFAAAGDPNSFVSIVDPPSVNFKGGRLWGETVFLKLGGAPEDIPPPEVPTPAPAPTATPTS